MFPSTGTGHAAWASSPSCRGSFEIISLCLGTTIICIWSSIHWDIPLQRVDTDLPAIYGWSLKDVKGRLKHKVTVICRSLLSHGPLVLVAVFCPELLLFYAIDQLLYARKLRKEFSKVLEEISLGKEAVSGQSRHDGLQVSYYCDTPSSWFSPHHYFRMASRWKGNQVETNAEIPWLGVNTMVHRSVNSAMPRPRGFYCHFFSSGKANPK